MGSGRRNQNRGYFLTIHKEPEPYESCNIELRAGNQRIMMESRFYSDYGKALQAARRIAEGLGMPVYCKGQRVIW